MPIHDWTRVDAGTFHAFHTAWVTHLSETLNDGILPPGYYALPEQHLGKTIGDVLTLHSGTPSEQAPSPEAGTLLLETPPRVGKKVTASATPRALRRTLAVRHISGHRIIALLEIVSPANKDRPRHVDEFAAKAVTALCNGVHLLLVDVFPPGLHDPQGMHHAIWRKLTDEAEDHEPSAQAPLVLASYVAREPWEAYVEKVAVGDNLPDMPLFLDADHYVNSPLESTYQAAFRGLPRYWRQVLENGA
jgi:hypothetical protein